MTKAILKMRQLGVTDLSRQSGHTTQQMIAAPVGALFVWCNEATSYPKLLASHLGRGDLKILPRSWFVEERWVGRINSSTRIVIDHNFFGAGHITGRLWDAMRYLNYRGVLRDEDAEMDAVLYVAVHTKATFFRDNIAAMLNRRAVHRDRAS